MHVKILRIKNISALNFNHNYIYIYIYIRKAQLILYHDKFISTIVELPHQMANNFNGAIPGKETLL